MTDQNHSALAFEIFEKLTQNEFSYIYNGLFSNSITDQIINLGEQSIEKFNKPAKDRKKVFSVIVESLQNITRHHDDAGKNNGLFAIELINGNYYLTAVNLIYNNKIEYLQNKLNALQSASFEELKDLYREVLKDNEFSEKGGAGLGLLEIAKKTNNKFYFKFQQVDENYSYFYLHPYIINTEQEEEVNKKQENRAKEVIQFHELIQKNNIFTIFGGIFDQSILISLLDITSNQMTRLVPQRRKIFSLMIEMLQNIIKHGYPNDINKGNPGAFFINCQGNKYILNSGNLIHKLDMEVLQNKIDFLNSLNDEQLNELYNDNLVNFQIDSSISAGLGLIDIRIKSNNPLKYYFKDIGNSESVFFILEATID